MIHKKRREELLSKLGDDAVVIVSTNSEQKRNSDVNYPFRPDSSFWYLTGFIEPDAIAVFSKNKYSIFLRPKDKTQEIWNGVRLGVDLAPETLLVDYAYDINTFTDENGTLADINSMLNQAHLDQFTVDGVKSGTEAMARISPVFGSITTAAARPTRLRVFSTKHCTRESMVSSTREPTSGLM